MKRETLTLILAGGTGSRLAPLTRDRAKPAVPFGGKYRIIDFSLANCLHSGLRKILVLTQYKSFSLQKHLRDAWSLFNPEMGEYVTHVPPQMNTGDKWYSGTADAVYQNLYLLKRSGAKRVLILSGDHIYRMDYEALLRYHREHESGLTVATIDVPLEEAKGLGVLAMDESGRVTAFQEKPDQPSPMPDNENRAQASMGVYVFSIDVLIRELEKDAANPVSSHDFGKDIIPDMIQAEGVYAYRFGSTEGRVSQDHYWRDVGTLDAYYQANMDLLDPIPKLDLYQRDWPIRTWQSQYPPARTVPGASGSEGIFINSIASGGVVVAGGVVAHSILSPNVYLDDEAVVHDSLLFNDVQVGRGAELQRCIVDKDVDIPPATRIGFDPQQDAARFTISPDGVVVVPRGYRFE